MINQKPDANNRLLALPEELQERIWRNVYDVNVVEQFKDLVEKRAYSHEYWPEMTSPQHLSIREPFKHEKWFNPITEEFVDNTVTFGRGLVFWLLNHTDLEECGFHDEGDYEYWEDVQRFFGGECFAYDSQSFYTVDMYFCRVDDDFDPEDYDPAQFEETIDMYENYNEGDSFDRDRFLPFIPY